MALFQRSRLILGGGLLVATMTGCHERVVSNDGVITWQLERWVGIVSIIAGVGCILAGIVRLRMDLRRSSDPASSRHRAVGLLIVGTFLLVIMSPGLIIDRVVIRRDEFEFSKGLFFDRAKYVIRFDEEKVMEVFFDGEEQFIRFTGKAGVRQFPTGDLMRSGFLDIGTAARQAGVEVKGIY